jgi:hypothetical protein
MLMTIHDKATPRAPRRRGAAVAAQRRRPEQGNEVRIGSEPIRRPGRRARLGQAQGGLGLSKKWREVRERLAQPVEDAARQQGQRLGLVMSLKVFGRSVAVVTRVFATRRGGVVLVGILAARARCTLRMLVTVRVVMGVMVVGVIAVGGMSLSEEDVTPIYVREMTEGPMNVIKPVANAVNEGQGNACPEPRVKERASRVPSPILPKRQRASPS